MSNCSFSRNRTNAMTSSLPSAIMAKHTMISSRLKHDIRTTSGECMHNYKTRLHINIHLNPFLPKQFDLCCPSLGNLVIQCWISLGKDARISVFNTCSKLDFETGLEARLTNASLHHQEVPLSTLLSITSFAFFPKHIPSAWWSSKQVSNHISKTIPNTLHTTSNRSCVPARIPITCSNLFRTRSMYKSVAPPAYKWSVVDLGLGL